ncbi:MAG TPA: SWIM zinc finger family protein, partial [Oscillatoriaceae cyanobacterium]
EQALATPIDQPRNNKRRRNRKEKQPQQQPSRKKRFEQDRTRRVRPAGRENLEISRRGGDENFTRHAETWWADKWLYTLNRFGWKGRLANGRLYAKDGRVVAFTVEAGRIRARVQGSRLEPYDVTIQLKALSEGDWDLVVDVMSCQAVFTAQLLAGEMPLDVEEAFEAAYAPLFPRSQADIQARCSCPDPVNPCKHIAAVYYVMAEAFDKDPFMIFLLRGRSREALLAMLRAARAAEAKAAPMAVETFEGSSLDSLRFWQAGEELETVHIAIQTPALPGGIAKRLGRPPFWRSPADPVTRLGEIYESLAKRAREVALADQLAGSGVEH